MSYTADTALITAAMAHCETSSAKTAFTTDLGTLMTQIQTRTASFPNDAGALRVETALLNLARVIADELNT